jgi:hypothetical protein
MPAKAKVAGMASSYLKPMQNWYKVLKRLDTRFRRHDEFTGLAKALIY